MTAYDLDDKVLEVHRRLARWWVAGTRAGAPQGASRKLGRWLVLATSDDSPRNRFYIRTPPNRCIGLYDQEVGFNQIDGWLYRMSWSGDPTDEEKAEIILAI